MSAFNWLKQKVGEGRDALAKEVGKFKNKEFMQATVAGCAIIAAADGSISSSEKQKMIGFIQNSDELKVFNTADVIAEFNKFVSGFEFDAAIGKAEALKAVGKLRNNVDAARLLVRVCIAVGASDGNFDPSEREAAKQICKELGLNASDFEL